MLREQIVILHRRLLTIVREDEVCRRLMTTPGVGPVVALTYRATVNVPARFRKSKSVGAVFGLTCSRPVTQHDLKMPVGSCCDDAQRPFGHLALEFQLDWISPVRFRCAVQQRKSKFAGLTGASSPTTTYKN